MMIVDSAPAPCAQAALAPLAVDLARGLLLALGWLWLCLRRSFESLLGRRQVDS